MGRKQIGIWPHKFPFVEAQVTVAAG